MVLAFMPILADRPGSKPTGRLTKRPLSVGTVSPCAPISALCPERTEGTKLPVSETVKLGINSMVRSVEMPSSPVMCPS